MFVKLKQNVLGNVEGDVVEVSAARGKWLKAHKMAVAFTGDPPNESRSTATVLTRPSKAASTADWAAWVLAKFGVDEDEIKDLRRGELIDLYGGD